MDRDLRHSARGTRSTVDEQLGLARRRARVRWVCAATAICVLWSGSLHGIERAEMIFRRLSVEEGLSQNTVTSIVQDDVGFLWFGTQDGLNRYDGYRLKVYRHDPSEPASLPDNSILALALGPSGDLWIGTRGGGLARYRAATDDFTTYRHDPEVSTSLADDRVQALLWEPTGSALWIGFYESGLDRFDPQTEEFVHHRAGSAVGRLSDDRVRALHLDSRRQLWVGTLGGLNFLNPRTHDFLSYRHDPARLTTLSDDRVRTLLEDGLGGLWVGTLNGLNRLDLSTRRVQRYYHEPNDSRSLNDNRVRSLYQDSIGRLWIGTDAGLALLQEPERTFRRFRHDSGSSKSLSGDRVMAIFEDSGHQLWVGTQGGGVNHWNPVTWSFQLYESVPANANSLSSNAIFAVSTGPDRSLWIGTLGSGLDRVDRETDEIANYRHDPTDPASLSQDQVISLAHGDDGTLWAGTTAAGLNRLDPGSERFVRYSHDAADPSSLGADGIMSLFVASDGALWIGTFGGGLNRLEKPREAARMERWRHDPSDPDSLGGDRVTSFAEYQDAMWIGTDGGGLSRWDPLQRRFITFTNDGSDATSLPNDSVTSLHVDPNGRLWLGSEGGGIGRLESYDTEARTAEFRRFRQEDGLVSDTVYGIHSDAEATLWISTIGGLSRLDQQSMRFNTYRASHGLGGNEFNLGAHHRSSQGELFFGGFHGLNAFFPDDVRANDHVPPVVLTSFTRQGEVVEFDRPLHELDEARFSHRDNSFSMEFAALDFTAPEQNRYSYQLIGLDDDWIDNGADRRVTYTNLDPGSYTLRVRAANNEGVWNDVGTSLAFRVVPPAWRTWWAYTLYALAALAVVASYLRVQSRKLRLAEEYRARLEREVTKRTEQLKIQNEELATLNSRLEETSLTDPLTGLRNRRFVQEHVAATLTGVDREIRVAEREDEPFPTGAMRFFLMFDLDGFKVVNDEFGHAAGDRVLRQVEGVLQKCCRTSDTLVRWGGDEFMVFAKGFERSGIATFAERIRSEVAHHSFDLGEGRTCRLTASIGVARYPFARSQPDLLSWEQTVAIADAALYIAKNRGKNGWVAAYSSEGRLPSSFAEELRTNPNDLLESACIELEGSICEYKAVV